VIVTPPEAEGEELFDNAPPAPCEFGRTRKALPVRRIAVLFGIELELKNQKSAQMAFNS